MTENGLLTGPEIMELIAKLKPPLIENYRYIRQQVQPCGFDLTLANIKTVASMNATGTVDFSRAKQFFADLVEVGIDEVIQPLRPYVLTSAEVVNMPLDLTAICITRSSLTRCGAVLGSGVVDAGFRGHLAFSLISTMPLRIKRGDRFVQILFFRHAPSFAYTGQYAEVLKSQ